jgi:hypothetical protein
VDQLKDESMRRLQQFSSGLFASLAIAIAGTAWADPIDLFVGDNDGYGVGTPDNAPHDAILYDNRSAAEIAATNGAQFTDRSLSIIDPANTPFTAVFALAGDLTSGSVTIDANGIQADLVPQIEVFFNGLLQANVLNLALGAFGTQLVTVPITAAVLAAGAGTGQFIVSFGANPSDIVGFDFIRLTGDVTSTKVPEPGTLLLLGAAALALGWHRRQVK